MVAKQNFIEFSIENVKAKRIPKSSRYWSFESIVQKQNYNQFVGSEKDATNQLDNLLRKSISGQLLGDVALGAFLSSGIDSSTVVSLISLHHSCVGCVITPGVPVVPVSSVCGDD